MHFLQSQIWKESKKNLGNQIFDVGQYFFHTTRLPVIPKTVGYMPRPNLRSVDWAELIQKAIEAKVVYMTIDPENIATEIPSSIDYIQKKLLLINPKIQVVAGKPVHLKDNMLLNLSKPSEELLSLMKQKHRYNLKLAAKKGVEVDISDSKEMLEEFLQLYQETVDRKEYNGRSAEYIYTVWKTIKEFKGADKCDVQIATAYFENKPLASWMLFIYGDTIYYPYGGSSAEMKSIMAPYALVWAIVEWGKAKGYQWFDMWGVKPIGQAILDVEPTYDSFSRFKVGFGGDIIKHADTVDIVFDPLVYKALKLAQKIRR